MRRPALLVAFALTGGCDSCKTPPPSPPPPSVDAASPAVDAAVGDAGVDAGLREGARFGGELGDVELLAGGRVLFTGGDTRRLYEWDSATAELVRIPVESDDAKTEIHLGLGSVFVVERMSAGTAEGRLRRVHELWDSAKHTKIKDLSGPWLSWQTSHAISEDKRRFLAATCPSDADAGSEWAACEVSVFALPAGTLVHRTVMPSLHFERYGASFTLSPTGKYFAFASGWLDSMIYETATGTLVYPAESEVRPDLMSSDHVEVDLLGDDRAVVEKNSSTRLVAIDLAERREIGNQEYELRKGESAARGIGSPDRKRVATSLTLMRGHELAVWNLDDDTTKRIPIPSKLCAGGFCRPEWASATEIELASGSVHPAPERIRIDVATRAQISDPARMPSVVQHGFRVQFHRKKSAKELADDPAETDTIVTPTGKTLALPTVGGVHAEVVDGRLLLYGGGSVVRVIDREGNHTALRGASR